MADQHLPRDGGQPSPGAGYARSTGGALRRPLAWIAVLIFCLSTPSACRSLPSDPGQPDLPESLPEPAGLALATPDPDTAWYVAGCDHLPFSPITDFEVRQTPARAEPAARLPFADPVFGTCLVRVTDRSADLVAGDDSEGLKNEYARVQSFNADGSLLMAYTTEGNWYLYDAHTLAPLGQLPIWQEPRWDAVDPDLLYYTADTRLLAYRLSSGQQDLVHDFAQDFPGEQLAAVWTRYEGSPSAIGLHFSGRASQLPGWALVSTSNGSQPAATWLDDQIFAVELVAGGRVVRLAHTHSLYDEHSEHDYWAEPHASVNQDFTAIVFTSNWGRAGSPQVEMYWIHLPQDWVTQLP